MLRPKIELMQFTDNQIFTNTLVSLNNFDPITIIFCDTAKNSALYNVITNEFDIVNIELFGRKYFNENKALEYIETYCNIEDSNKDDFDISKYLCLSSAAVLFKYCQVHYNAIFSPKSLYIEFKTLDGYMKLNSQTIHALELISNNVNPKDKSPGTSLFNTLNKCKTHNGKRLLRSNILQPLTDINAINARLDCIEELLSSETLFYSLNNVLSQFTDIDQAIRCLVYKSKNINEKICSSIILSILKLKSTLNSLVSLYELLNNHTKHPLLKLICDNINDESAYILKDEISKVLNENVTTNKIKLNNNTIQARNKIVMGLKSEMNSLLDVARAAYCEAYEEIINEVESIRHELKCNDIKLHFTNARLYHLKIPLYIYNDENLDTDQLKYPVIKNKFKICLLYN